MCKLLEEAMDRNGEMTERRVADRRVVAVAGSDAWKDLAMYTGKDIATIYTFETEEFVLMEDVVKLLARTPASAPSADRNSVLEEVAAHFDSKSRMCNPAYVSEFVRSLKTETGAAPQQVDAVQAVPESIKQLVLSSALAEGYALMALMRDDVTGAQFSSALSAFAAAVLASPSPAVPTKAEWRDQHLQAVDLLDQALAYVGCASWSPSLHEEITHFVLSAAPLAQPTDTTAGE